MKILFIIIFFTLLSLRAFAQSETEENSLKWGIAILPQCAIANTMRIDVDRQLSNNNVLTIAPMFSFARNSSLIFTSSTDNNDYEYYDDNYPENISLTGGGLKFNLRHFVGDFINKTGLYIGGGLHYKFSHLEYEQNGWKTSDYNGDDYLHYGTFDYEQNINQVGLDCFLGYQLNMVDNIFIDVFAGWGFRLSDYDDEDDEGDYWSETIFDLGYSGYTPLLGLRLGVFF